MNLYLLSANVSESQTILKLGPNVKTESVH